jgi:hypothetical protein
LAQLYRPLQVLVQYHAGRSSGNSLYQPRKT